MLKICTFGKEVSTLTGCPTGSSSLYNTSLQTISAPNVITNNEPNVV